MRQMDVKKLRGLWIGQGNHPEPALAPYCKYFGVYIDGVSLFRKVTFRWFGICRFQGIAVCVWV